MRIEIKVLNKEFYQKEKLGGVYYDLPSYQTFGSVGLDLYCTEDVDLFPGDRKMISTGLAIWIGSDRSALSVKSELWGHTDICIMGAIVPRSGLGTKGLVLANTIGIIDEDYQGELKISAWNSNDRIGWENIYLYEDKDCWLGKEPYDKNDSKDSAIQLIAGDRIAQLIFMPVIKAQWDLVEEFSDETRRRNGGFGSTG